MNYQLICLDLDGTLLDDQKKILPRARESVKQAAEQGIKIALVSGRMPLPQRNRQKRRPFYRFVTCAVDPIEEELGISCIKACNAGTYILKDGQCISSEYLLADTMKRIYEEIAERYQMPLWIFRHNRWFVTGSDRYVEKESEIIHHRPEFADVEELAAEWAKEGTGPNKLVLAASPDEITEIYNVIAAQNRTDLDMARSADTFLEIFPKGVTKGTALKAICQSLDVKPENVIAFGDHELDVPMIEAAGVGIAMGNAIDELKAKVDFATTPSRTTGTP